MNATHCGWSIEITGSRFKSTCCVTDPNGEEYMLYCSENQDAASILAMARAFINRQIRLDQEEATWQR